MEKLYILNNSDDRDDFCRSIIGIKNSKIYHLKVVRDIIDNELNRSLKPTFEYCNLESNESPIDALFEKSEIYSQSRLSKSHFKLIELTNRPGEYYPRIYRPFLEPSESPISNKQKLDKLETALFNFPNRNLNNISIIVSGINQLLALTRMLTEILNTIHPTETNLEAYGHRIKNLLILSCVEVESQLKGIYKANEVSGKERYNTQDYIKLKDILKLNKYSVRLALYPGLRTYYPFKNWNKEIGATKSLKWYDNYNSVKHNSETEFHKATLDSAIQGVSAVVILLKAQYGPNIPFWREEIGSYYEVKSSIEWKNIERIIPPLNEENWRIKKIEL